MSMKLRNNIFLAIGSVAIVAASGVGVYAMYSNAKMGTNGNSPKVELTTSNFSTQDSSSPTDSTSSSGSSTSSTSSSYEDGTYKASTNYSVPHGYQNSISVSVTIKDGSVTSASATHSTSDHESAEYTDLFDSSLSSKVVGVSLSGASFSRIGGASLTTDGFQSAIETIMDEAAA